MDKPARTRLLIGLSEKYKKLSKDFWLRLTPTQRKERQERVKAAHIKERTILRTLIQEHEQRKGQRAMDQRLLRDMEIKLKRSATLSTEEKYALLALRQLNSTSWE